MAKHLRDPQREAYWRGVLKRHAGSGLSVRVFCQREKLTESTFFAWRRTIQQRDAKVKQNGLATASLRRGGRLKRPAFLPVMVDNDHGRDGAIAIERAGGRMLRFPESIATERLVALVHALEARVEQ